MALPRAAVDVDDAPPDGPATANVVVTFGQEIGRVLSDGRIIGRAEPYAKVFPSSREVKRAVGVVAWAVLEDIALDARIDDQGRLVAETSVRRVAANLGVSKNTVNKHLAKLREHGFVLHEARRDDRSGCWSRSHYVLDPSACLERFTTTPGGEKAPRPKNRDTARRPTSRDDRVPPAGTAVSQSARPNDVGHLKEGPHAQKTEEDHHQDVRQPSHGPASQLRAAGVSAPVAEDLAAHHDPDLIAATLAAVPHGLRNPAGWIVRVIRTGKSPVPRFRTAPSRPLEFVAPEPEPDLDVRGWSDAVIEALDDDQLAEAVAKVTHPMEGLDRRSQAHVRAQLAVWAAHVASQQRGTTRMNHALLQSLAENPCHVPFMPTVSAYPAPRSAGRGPTASRLRRAIEAQIGATQNVGSPGHTKVPPQPRSRRG